MDKVVISPDAFRQIFSSALEAYAVPQGRRQNAQQHQPLETYGSIWGFSKENNLDICFYVIASDTETSAHRRAGSVQRKVGAQHIKTGFYEQFSPELSYLGDFHSHPYCQGEDDLTTAQNVESRRWYRFSGAPGDKNGDFASVRDIKKRGVPYRVGLVATVYRMAVCVENERTAHLTSVSDQKSALRFTYTGRDASNQISSFRCWLKAYTFTGADDTPTEDSKVCIHCGSLGLRP